MTLENIEKDYDLIIIGGGVTGAGILREAVRNQLKVLLVEQKDFSWGTSSRSSKLVHGGLRYLKEGRFFLTRESVRERERLLNEAAGLVEPLEFLLPIYNKKSPGKLTMEVGLSLYDLIAMKKRHKFYQHKEFLALEQLIDPTDLKGGFSFMDAQVDDARLVLRLINESVKHGATALNYTSAKEIHRNKNGHVSGLTVEDTESGESKTVFSQAVINASGVWAETLHPSPNPKLHLRPLRGSHIIFPASTLPFNRPVSFFHPEDHRPLFVIPWEGGVLFGTTDLDHEGDLFGEPSISENEMSYLLEGLMAAFPSVQVSPEDAISSFAGVRPVLSEGKLEASKESREHVVWIDKGLVTVTGGKLTTFRKLAWDTLKAVKPFLKKTELTGRQEPVFNPGKIEPGKMEPGKMETVPDLSLTSKQWRRLLGRYGKSAKEIVKNVPAKDLETIPGTETLWAELPYAAEYENVRHLTDLLLRRVRIGLLLPEGGKTEMERIRVLCEPKLPWDEKRWNGEITGYLQHWSSFYSAGRG